MAKTNPLIYVLIAVIVVIALRSQGITNPLEPTSVSGTSVIQKNPDSYSFVGVGEVSSHLEYTKPLGAVDAVWKVKIGKSGSPVNDLRIPDSCFNLGETLKLRVDHRSDYNLGTFSAAYCFDGNWVELYKKSGPACGPGGDGSCSSATSCVYVSGDLAFDDSYTTGITSYKNCNQVENFMSLDNAGMFWDEEMEWTVSDTAYDSCNVLYRTNFEPTSQCEDIPINPNSRWVVAMIDGELRTFGYAGCSAGGGVGNSLSVKDPWGNTVKYSPSASEYDLYVIRGQNEFKFSTSLFAPAVDVSTPKEPFISEKKEVYSTSSVSCPDLNKGDQSYCTLNTDCSSYTCLDNKCVVRY